MTQQETTMIKPRSCDICAKQCRYETAYQEITYAGQRMAMCDKHIKQAMAQSTGRDATSD